MKGKLLLTAGLITAGILGAGAVMPEYIPYSLSASAADMTVQNNEKIKLEKDTVVSGDLIIKDSGSLDLNGYSLTVTGNVIQRSSNNVMISGGTMLVFGDYTHESGVLNIGEGTVKILKNYAQQNTAGNAGEGEFRFSDTTGLLDVEGDVILNTTWAGYAYHSTGKLVIGGNFSAYGYAYRPSGTNEVAFRGAKEHTVFFESDKSYFGQVGVEEGGSLKLTGETKGFKMLSDMTFSDGSVITGSKELTLNGFSLTVDGDFYQEGDYSVNVYGSTLTVKGNYYQPEGVLNVGSGDVTIGGDYNMCGLDGLSGTGSVRFGEAGNLTVDGNVTMKTSWNGYAYHSSGNMCIGGDLAVYGSALRPSSNHSIEFKGQNKHTVYFDTIDSYMNDVSVEEGGSLFLTGNCSGFKAMSEINLAGGSTLKGPKDLKLNGHTINVDGNFYQDCNAFFVVQGGSLNVSGNYCQTGGVLSATDGSVKIGGNYVLQKPDGTTCTGELRFNYGSVEVGGDVIMDTDWDGYSYQSEGRFIIGGDLSVYGSSYRSWSDNVTEFKGYRLHKVYFDSTDSYLNKVEVSDGGTLYLDGKCSGFRLESDVKLAGGSAVCGSKTLDLNGNSLTVSGDFYQNDEVLVNLKNSSMTVLGNYYDPDGIIDVSDGILKIKGDLKMCLDKNKCGTGELKFGEGVLDVDGNVVLNTDWEGYAYHSSGKLIIGGDLSAYGLSYRPWSEHITEFKGKKAHKCYFETTGSYLNNIQIGVGDSLEFTKTLSGIPSGTINIEDTAVAAAKGAVITGKSEGETKISYVSDDKTINKTLTVTGVNEEFIDEIPLIYGDVNADGAFNIADLVTMQKWLLGDPKAELKCWQNGDLCRDEVIDTYDLVEMRKLIINA